MSGTSVLGNLTGLWQGFYSYLSGEATVPFGATMIETPGWVTGSTNEVCTRGPERGNALYATFEGHRNGRLVRFTKVYDGPAVLYPRVEYEGAINNDGTIIEGTWTVPRRWSGRFVMVRSRKSAAVRQREKFAWTE